MRRMRMLKSTIILITLFFLSCATHGILKDEKGSDEELNQLLLNLPSSDSFPDANVIYVLDESSIEVSEDGSSKRIDHTVVKILKESGKEFADVEIGFDSRTETARILYARTITPEGKVIPLNENVVKVVTPYSDYPSYGHYKELTFTMPGVTVGSVIDYRVLVKEKTPPIEREFSSGQTFQWYSPILLSRYRVSMPNNMELKYHILNPLKDVSNEPTILSEGNRKVYLWEYENLPQLLEEDYMPPSREVAFGVLVTTMDSWDDFFSWWKEKIKGKTEPDQAIREKVADLTKGLSNPEEKVEALFDYVKREIRYVSIGFGKTGYEPEPAPEVFKNKYGDCKDKSTLLISMLKVAGIPAHYVIIPTHSMRQLIKEFPYPFQFNHCIVAVEKDGRYHFIDPVYEYFPVGYLPKSDQNRDVVIYNDNQPLFTRTNLGVPEDNTDYEHQKIVIGKEGSIEGQVTSFGTGPEDASSRWTFGDSTPTRIREAVEKALSERFPGSKLLELAYSEPWNFKEPFKVDMKYRAPQYSTKAADLLIFQIPGIRPSCDAAGTQKRRYPVVFKTTSLEKREIEFNVPEGFEVYSLPGTTHLNNQYFEFNLNCRTEGNIIVYDSEFRTKATTISPEEYHAYYTSCETLGTDFSDEVVFRKKNQNRD
jgi:transglutaminase-like putative cysteine protease